MILLILNYPPALPNLYVMRVNRYSYIRWHFEQDRFLIQNFLLLRFSWKWISLQTRNFVLTSQSIVSGEIILPSAICCGHEHCMAMASQFFWCWHVYSQYKTQLNVMPWLSETDRLIASGRRSIVRAESGMWGGAGIELVCSLFGHVSGLASTFNQIFRLIVFFTPVPLNKDVIKSVRSQMELAKQ